MVSGSVAAPVNPGSIPAATIVSVNNAAHQAMQTRTSVGGGIAPFLFVSNTELKPFVPPHQITSSHEACGAFIIPCIIFLY